jgi:hypothetical protein
LYANPFQRSRETPPVANRRGIRCLPRSAELAELSNGGLIGALREVVSKRGEHPLRRNGDDGGGSLTRLKGKMAKLEHGKARLL